MEFVGRRKGLKRGARRAKELPGTLRTTETLDAFHSEHFDLGAQDTLAVAHVFAIIVP